MHDSDHEGSDETVCGRGALRWSCAWRLIWLSGFLLLGGALFLVESGNGTLSAPLQADALGMTALRVGVDPGTAHLEPGMPGDHQSGTPTRSASIISATFTTLVVGLLGTLMAVLIGILWAAVAGTASESRDAALMRVADGIHSFPALVLLILLVFVLERPVAEWWAGPKLAGSGVRMDLWLVVFALGAVTWPGLARVVRDRVRSLDRSGYVEAARASGGSNLQVWRTHVAPRVFASALVGGMRTLPVVMVYETILSSFGLGLQPPWSSLGCLLGMGVAG